MRSSGGRRLNNPKKVLCCNVTFLDDAVATYEIPKDAKGEVLFQSVVRSLDLSSESKYFGLLFTDQYDFPLWLDHDKKVCVCVCVFLTREPYRTATCRVLSFYRL